MANDNGQNIKFKREHTRESSSKNANASFRVQTFRSKYRVFRLNSAQSDRRLFNEDSSTKKQSAIYLNSSRQ